MKVEDIYRKSTEYFPVEKLTSKDLLPVYNKLSEIGYNEKNILEKLQVDYITFAKRHEIPKYLATTLKKNTPTDQLIKLFLLSLSVPESDVRETLGKEVFEIMLDMGLLSKTGEKAINSPINIFPCRGCLIVTDSSFVNVCVPKHVYPLMNDSYNLAHSIIMEPCEKTLDLCTGSGVQAIVASKFSKKVIGVDVNPRALNFARFNALLNQADNVEFRKGDLYEAVKGEKFDRILSNPPFVPSPEKRVYFRDGGPSGEDILKRIVAGLKDHLNEGSMCQIVTLLVFTGSDYNEKVASWVSGDNHHIFSIHAPRINVEDHIIYHLCAIRVCLLNNIAIKSSIGWSHIIKRV
jgi:carbamoyltransferase